MGRQWPLPRGKFTITSRFAGRINPVTGQAENHSGTDFAAPDGTPFYACAGGTVKYIGAASGYGHWIVIDHPDSEGGGCTEYGHMWNAFATGLRVGQWVNAGQLIGYVGSNGQSTGPHLHLTVWEYGYGGKRIDPETWLQGKPYPGEKPKATPVPAKPAVRAAVGAVLDWTSRFGFGQPRNTSLIRAICIHVTVNTPGTPAENVANYQIQSESGSYHELVDTGGNVLIENTDDWLSWSAGPKGNWCALHRSFVMRGTESQAEWRKYDAMLRAGAQRDAQWAKKYNIPVVKLTPAELRAGKRGFCAHYDVSLAWGESDHTDPGAGFPWDYYLQLVREYMNPAPAKKNEGGFSVDAERKIDLILDQLVGWEKDANGPKFTGWKPGDIRKSIAAKKANGSGLTLVEQIQDVSDRLSAVEAKIKGDK